MWGTLCGKGGWLMTVRERTEEIERITLSPFATLSENSRGRAVPEKPCPLRPCFQRDRDRIIHCKAFRRLKQKTQVFLSPEGDHYRTRLTHTLEVSQIARTIARALRLNEDLTEAIALAHDLGHTPFGHAGERALNRLCPGGFKHYEQSVRVVTKLEKDGSGLNLTWEVLTSVLGSTKSERITSLIMAIVEHGAEDIGMDAERAAAYEALHDFMYSTVYVDKVAKKEEQKVDKLIRELYAYFKDTPTHMPQAFLYIMWQEGVDRAVTDYISGMSDEYATSTFESLFVPQKWQIL